MGAFTKSAQFPFHFWLPNANGAPTPVSAYLHSAHHGQGRVFLLARMSPVLAEPRLECDTGRLGAVTRVYSALVAVTTLDLKQVLALHHCDGPGTSVMFLGLSTGATPHSAAAIAAIAFILVHALYKAALFMTVGAIERATGSRVWARTGGLRANVIGPTFVGEALAVSRWPACPRSSALSQGNCLFERI